MSAAEVLNADGGLVGFAELELRWKPAGKTAEARRRVVREQCARLGLRRCLVVGVRRCALSLPM
jgi:hypothetical protein